MRSSSGGKVTWSNVLSLKHSLMGWERWREEVQTEVGGLFIALRQDGGPMAAVGVRTSPACLWKLMISPTPGCDSFAHSQQGPST